MNTNFDIETFMNDFCTNCSKVQVKTFSKEEVITNYIQNRNQLCLLIEGSADLVRYDLNGNKTIIEHFSKGNAFGEIFYTISTNNELFVEAKKSCKVHNELTTYFPEILLSKVIDLNTRIELLTKRSIREKLLGYFSILSTRSFSKTITLNDSLTNLADYLGIDRSAMMREIRSLKEDGIIKKSGNKITLLHK